MNKKDSTNSRTDVNHAKGTFVIATSSINDSVTRVSRVYFRIQLTKMPLCIQAINKHIYIHYS